MTEEIPDRPTWLDDGFLSTCLRNSHNINNKLNIAIKDVALTYVVPKGENYMSVMYRVDVKYQVESGPIIRGNIVAKVAYEAEKMAKFSRRMFDIEMDMYLQVMPKMEKILESKGLKTQLVCRCLHTIHEPKVIVFEDLKPAGFVVADRQKGMDLEHCKMVYSKIAKFHAAGMYHCNFQPHEMKKMRSKYNVSGFEIVLEDDKWNVPVMKARIKSNNIEMKKYNNRYKKAIDFCTKYDELLDKNGLPFPPYVPGGKFNAMTHTDFWVNNMLFKYKPNGSIADLLFVDLQCCHFTSVVFDFLFLFFTSSTLEVRKNNYNELKKFYFDSLVSNLKMLDYKGDIPTRHEFDEELKRNTLMVMFTILFMLPIILESLAKDKKSRENSQAFSMDELSDLMQNISGDDRNYLDKMLASFDILQDDGFLNTPPELLC